MSSGVKRPLSVLLSLALASGGLAAIASPASAAIHLPVAYGLTSSDRLVTFQVETAGSALLSDVAISKPTPGDDVVGIDVRPLTGELYALVQGVLNDRLAVINPATGVATYVGAPLTPRLTGTSFGVDFNPAVDRVRVVSDADENLRFHPVNGGASSVTSPSTTGDLALNYPTGDAGFGANPNVTAAGYSNNIPGGNTAVTPVTDLFDIDTGRDTLVKQTPPNNGTLVTVGPLNVGDVTSVAGFDIAGSDLGTAKGYAVLTVAGTDALYTLDTGTGTASKVADFPAAANIEDLTVADPRFVIAATGTAVEGSSVTVAVTRVGDTRFAGSINYTTANGTAAAGTDYTATNGTLSYAAGETTKSIVVPTTGDLVTEGPETLSITLSAPVGQNATVGRTTSAVTITEAATAYALLSDNRISTFNLSTPGTIPSPVTITGLAVGEDVVGIDVRPSNGLVYGVTSASRVITINPSSGAATPVGAPFTPALSGTSFGVDVNPVPNLLRVVSDTGQNLRLNMDTGAVAGNDTALNGGATGAFAAGYTNSFAGATGTTLYDVNSGSDTLYIQAPPNNGTLTAVGPLGIDVTDVGDLDIAAAGNTAYAAFTPAAGAASLYRVDLATGAASIIGAFGSTLVEDLALASPGRLSAANAATDEGQSSVTVTVTRTAGSSGPLTVDYATADTGTAKSGSDFTATSGTLSFADGETSKAIIVPILQDSALEGSETFPVNFTNPQGGTGAVASATVTIADDEPSTAYALTSDNRIATFSVATPGTFSNNVAITGLAGGEDVVGIDLRPANGELLALGSTGKLYTLNPATGVATAKSGTAATLAGTSFGFDVNPVPDRVRVVSDAEQNLRLNPDTGVVAATDLPLNYAAGDANVGQDPTIIGAGYTNSVAGATSTTLYDIDSNLNILVTQTPPNDGKLNTVGPLGVDVTSSGDLDIAANGNAAFGALTPVGGVPTLYRIDLSTGALTSLGAFALTTVEDLALATPGRIGFSTATATVAEAAGTLTVTVNRAGGSTGPATVDYATSDAGTADSGADFTATSGTLAFADGETTKQFVVPIVQDSLLEGAETFPVTLSNASSGAGLGPITTLTVSISDDETGKAFGLTDTNRIVTLDPVNPTASPTANVVVLGLASGEDLLGIDVRPATGLLYGISSLGKIYAIDPATGDTQLVSTSTTVPSGTAFGVDFNPVPDRLRVVSNTGQSLRINVDTGAATVDGSLAYASTDPGSGSTPAVAAAGYTNSVAGATATQLFDIDTARDVLVLQSPPNDGTLTTIGALGLDVTSVAGLDIANPGNSAFAVLRTASTGPSLYRVDLTSGGASSLGVLSVTNLEDLTLQVPAVAKAGRYHPLPPTRLLDTRNTATRVTAGTDRVVVVAGQAGVPASGVSAVVLNVTNTRSPGRGNLAVYPTGQQPTTRTSNLNFERGENIAVQVQTGLGSGGAVSLRVNTGSTDVVIDVLGWYGDGTDAAGLGYQTLTPQRVLDTRTTATPLRAGSDQVLQLSGRAGVPAGAKAVAVNLTVTDASGSVDVQLYPGGTPPTTRTSSINVVRGQTIANAAVATLGPDGTIGLSVNAGQVSVIVDVVGYYGATAAGRFTPVTPVRLLDTRASGGPVTPAADAVVTVAGAGGVPTTAVAGVLSVTGTQAANVLNVQVFPTGRPPVTRTSTLNMRPSRDIANLAVAALGTGGATSLHVSQFSTHLVVDVTGYFLPS